MNVNKELLESLNEIKRILNSYNFDEIISELGNDNTDDIEESGYIKMSNGSLGDFMKEHKNDVTYSDKLKTSVVNFLKIKDIENLFEKLYKNISNDDEVSSVITNIFDNIGYKYLREIFSIEDRTAIEYLFTSVITPYIIHRSDKSLSSIDNDSLKINFGFFCNTNDPDGKISDKIVDMETEYNIKYKMFYLIMIYTIFKKDTLPDHISIHVNSYIRIFYITYTKLLLIVYNNNIDSIHNDLMMFIKSKLEDIAPEVDLSYMEREMEIYKGFMDFIVQNGSSLYNMDIFNNYTNNIIEYINKFSVKTHEIPESSGSDLKITDTDFKRIKDLISSGNDIDINEYSDCEKILIKKFKYMIDILNINPNDMNNKDLKTFMNSIDESYLEI